MTSLERARRDLWTFAFLLGFLFALVMRLTRHLDEHQAAVDELAGTAAGAVVAAAAAAAEAQARTPERVFIGDAVDDGLVCKRCDVYVGMRAAGVVKPPDESHPWLLSHCWVCRRSADEIREAQAA